MARDGRIPKPLRALAAIGALPIPGPFDEAILLLVAPPLFMFYREPMREAWHRAAERSVGKLGGWSCESRNRSDANFD